MTTPEQYTESQARDPETPAATLADIATHRADLRPAIALNPTTYPDLLKWLGDLNDPAINQALATRGHATGPIPTAAQQQTGAAAEQTAVHEPVPAQTSQTQPAPAAQVYAAQPASGPSVFQPADDEWNFKGMTVRDIIRDVLAAALLLLSLPLIWHGDDSAKERPEVLVITLLSVLSLGLPYLARIGAMGPKWTVHSTRGARMLLNAPYFLLVLAYVVVDVVKYKDALGIGVAAMFGLTGAVLAAQPRESEIGPEGQDNAGKQWLGITSALGGFIAVTYIASLVIFIIQVIDAPSVPTLPVVASIVTWLLVVVFSLWIVFATSVGRSPSWRRALIGLGVSLIVIVFIAEPDTTLVVSQSVAGVAAGGEGIIPVVPLSLVNGLGALFIPAAAAAAANPAVSRAVKQQPEVQTWIEGARAVALYVGFVAFTAFVGAVLGFWTLDGADGRPLSFLITTLVLSLVTIGVALFAANALGTDPVSGRAKGIAAAVAIGVLGILIVMSVPSDLVGGDVRFVSVGHLLLAAALPITMLILLLAPKVVREFIAGQKTQRPVNEAAFKWTPPTNAGNYQQPAQQPQQGSHVGY